MRAKRTNQIAEHKTDQLTPRPYQALFSFASHDTGSDRTSETGRIIKPRSQAAAERDCKDITRRAVMATGICESCQENASEVQHHGLLRSNQRVKLNPTLLFDPDTQFELCTECHVVNEDAAHVDNETFLDKMEAKGGEDQGDQPRAIRDRTKLDDRL